METWVVAYDIADDRRRERIARVLDDFGRRVQESVFEIWVDDQDWEDLRRRLDPLVDTSRDLVRCYPVCKSCRQKCLDLGSSGKGAFVREEVIFA
jgi:CRISPR-associated protein Cas2